MKLSFNLETGRSKTQERALNAETSTADKDAAINTRLPSLPGQPIDVHNSNQAMKLSAHIDVLPFFREQLRHYRL